jgi:hypothetical protein
VTEELLVLGEPLVGDVPVERDVPAEEARRLDRVLVSPDGVGRCPRADAKRPVAGLPLVRAVRALLASLEQVLADVAEREVVDGQVPRLVQELRVCRVDHGLPGEERSDPLGHRIEVDDRAGRRLDLHVEAAGRLLGERALACGERHA